MSENTTNQLDPDLSQIIQVYLRGLAVAARVQGMTTRNIALEFADEPPHYSEEDFAFEADRLHQLADQLAP